MNPFQDKYHHKKGTHCWFCDRKFGEVYYGEILMRTKEHIVPFKVMGFNHPKNYVASCKFCNTFKSWYDARGFVDRINWYYENRDKSTFWMHDLLPLMRQRAWKLYNKTSKLHQKYSIVKK